MERVAYTPKEFAELFGKSQTWGYRQIYQGAVSAITDHGRTLIPASEVEKILKSAAPNPSIPATPENQPGKPAETIRETMIRGSRNLLAIKHGQIKRNVPKGASEGSKG